MVNFNGAVHVDPYEWQVGNGNLPLDVLRQAQVPKPALGAGFLPPGGPYATEMDVNPNPEPPVVPNSHLGSLALVAVALMLLFMRG